MSADRRTLLIAAVAMVVLVAVGVTSAALFTRSACGPATPEQVAAGTAGHDAAAVLAEALPDLGPGDIERLVDALGGLAGELDLIGEPDAASRLAGPVAAAEVGPADRLASSDGRLVAIGERLTTLTPPGDVVEPDTAPTIEAEGGDVDAVAGPAAAIDDPAVVVGDGSTLYSLARVNDLTGQVDAIVPVSTDLAGADCIDTAQVGVPLTFHLDAADGQLLLFRVDEDGEHPEVEVRDADGAVWSERIVLGAGPPGALAERLGGVLGGDLMVTARRTRADEDPPALQARDRATGAERWAVAPPEVAEHMPPGDEALEIEPLAVTDELVLAAASREDDDSTLLLAFEVEDGTWRWTVDPGADATPRVVGERDDGQLFVLTPVRREGEEVTGHGLVSLTPDEGHATLVHGTGGAAAGAATVGGVLLLGTEDGLALVSAATGQGQDVGELPVSVADVATLGETTALLLRDGDHGAVVWLGG